MKDLLLDFAREEVKTYLNNNDFYSQLNAIGSYGKIIFKVSEENILTPGSYKIQIGNKVQKHSPLNSPEITEFQSRTLKKISFPIKLSSSFTDISKALSHFTNYCENGVHYPLILSGEKIGEHNFRVESFAYDIVKVDPLGTPLIVNANITLEEYIENLTQKKTQEIKKRATTKIEKKLIKNINSTVISTLQGGRLW